MIFIILIVAIGVSAHSCFGADPKRTISGNFAMMQMFDMFRTLNVASSTPGSLGTAIELGKPSVYQQPQPHACAAAAASASRPPRQLAPATASAKPAPLQLPAASAQSQQSYPQPATSPRSLLQSKKPTAQQQSTVFFGKSNH